ncbi:MAG: permease [Actinobacteria bacterium]|nr:MAG: permease [Actinomycetota bacterium]
MHLVHDLFQLATVTHSIGRALSFAFGMFWEVLWALILGFFLSAAVQAVVRKSEMRRLMGDDSPRSIAIATGLGAASSSCSYAAVALARSLFRKGANFTAAMAFEIAATNLVVELGIIMALLVGWQFTVGEFVGGPLMIVIVAVLFRRLLSRQLLDEARRQADRGLLGSMEGHAEMDMSVARRGSIPERLLSRDGLDATAGYFVMDWAAVARDIFGGLLIAGALSTIWGPIVGPFVAVISFVCSIGNVPLAAILWNGGISFGGVLSFIFADLIILPILNIYRKYYGLRVSVLIAASFYAAMVVAGLVVDLVFKTAGLVRTARDAKVIEASVHWNYTTFLNIAFLGLAAILVYRFIRGGGIPMLRAMSKPMPEHGHGHAMPQ